jgi:hypothetical protein
MATMVQLIQQATGEMGLQVPTYVAGNTAQDTIQQLALLNAVGYELQRQWDWNALCTEYRFTTSYTQTTGNLTSGLAVVTGIPSTTGFDTTYMVTGTGVATDVYVQSVDSPTQVTLSVPAQITGTGVTLNFCKTKYSNPSDFDRQIDTTQWDKTKHWQMLGPETAQQWQWLKSGYISTGPRLRFRRLGGTFQIWPPITANELLGMEYVSNKWAVDANGNGKGSFTVDTDSCIYPDRLMVLGLKLKYFSVKGFNADEFRMQYQAELNIAKANDKGAPVLSFAPEISQVLIGIANVPDTGYGS